MFHQGDARADIHRMVQVVARYEDGGTGLLVVLFQQMLDDGLRTWVKEIEWFVENQDLRLVEEGRDDAKQYYRYSIQYHDEW